MSIPLSVDQFHLPQHILDEILTTDETLALRMYGCGKISRPHHLPCVVKSISARCVWYAILLGVFGIECSPCFVFHGPAGADLPGGKDGDNNSNGVVFRSVSSTKTRFEGDSAANGWHMWVHNVRKTRIKVLRKEHGGWGFVNDSPPRLAWLYYVWQLLSTAAPSLAETLVGWVPDPVSLPRPVVPVESLTYNATVGLALACHLRAAKRPNKDRHMRDRTAKHPRQSLRSTRPRESRCPFGSRIANPEAHLRYKHVFRVGELVSGDNAMLLFQCECVRKRDVEVFVPVEQFTRRTSADDVAAAARDVLEKLTHAQQIATTAPFTVDEILSLFEQNTS